MCTLIGRVGQAKEGGRCQPVSNYKDDGPRETSGGLNKDTACNQAHMANGGVGNEGLKVRLS